MRIYNPATQQYAEVSDRSAAVWMSVGGWIPAADEPTGQLEPLDGNAEDGGEVAEGSENAAEKTAATGPRRATHSKDK